MQGNIHRFLKIFLCGGKGFFLQELGRIFVCVRLALRPKKDKNLCRKEEKK